MKGAAFIAARAMKWSQGYTFFLDLRGIVSAAVLYLVGIVVNLG